MGACSVGLITMDLDRQRAMGACYSPDLPKPTVKKTPPSYAGGVGLRLAKPW